MISARGRWSRSQIAAVAGVCVVVAALFGFLALNRGSGSSSEAAASETSSTVAPASTTEVTEPQGPTVTAAPMATAVPTTEPTGEPGEPDDFANQELGTDNVPVDAERFCAGVNGITQLEGALAASFRAQDIEGVRRAVADHRQSWTTGVTDMVEAGPPIYTMEFERYRDVYVWLLSIVDTGGDLERFGNGYPQEYRDRPTNPEDAINAATREHCG